MSSLLFRAMRKAAYLGSGPLAFLGRHILKMDRCIRDYGPEMSDDFNYIVIFGAGLLWRTGEPSPVLRDRLELALQLREASGREYCFLCSGDGREPDYDEPGKMKEYLCSRGVPERLVLLDREGFSTSETIARLKRFGIDNAILVTNDFHMPRAAFLAREAGIRYACAQVRVQGYLRHRETCNREGLAQWKDFYMNSLSKLRAGLKALTLRLLPTHLAKAFQYLFRVHRVPHLFRPRRFTEKICFASADPHMGRLSAYADKAAVRSYVERCVGAEHLVPVHAILRDPEEFLTQEIPQRVFVKPNHASGLYASFEPDWMSRRPMLETLRRWKKCDYASVTGERQYAEIPFRILLEKNVHDLSGSCRMLRAYCFNGRIEMMYITQDNARESWQLTRDFEPSPVLFFFAQTDNVYTPPPYADDMIEGIEKLAKPFPFVRVDVYLLENDWLFSELTFTPHTCLMKVKPEKEDRRLGQLLDRQLWETAPIPDAAAETYDCSVVIVTHDRLEKLRRALESVLQQTHRPREILIMDTGTRNDAEEMLEAFQPYEQIAGNPALIRRFPLPSSVTAALARNEGIRRACGQWIAFLDDDDWWEPDKLEKQLHAVSLRQTPVSFIYTGSIRHYNNGMLVKKVPGLPADGDLSTEVLKRMICTSSTLMARKDLLEKIGGFDESLAFWQDTELLIRLSRHGEALCVPDFLTHIDCTWAKSSARLSDRVEGWEECVRYINQKHAALIERLSPRDQLERRRMIYEDGVRRCDSCGDPAKRRDYWKKLWVTTRRPIYLVSMLINLSPKMVYRVKSINGKLLFRQLGGI